MLTTHPGEKEIQVKRKCIIRPNADDGNNCERKFSRVQGSANPPKAPGLDESFRFRYTRQKLYRQLQVQKIAYYTTYIQAIGVI